MESDKFKYLGFFRAKVTENDVDGYKNYGVVRVFIPDLMIDGLDENFNENEMGILAFPANNPTGGRNPSDKDKTSFYQGSVIVPPKNSFVWIFFEKGNPNRPYYFAAWDAMASKMPQEHISVEEPHKVFTILKTREGRTFVISDDENTQRVEITGKKRNLSGNNPEGNSESTYTIDDNQTTILFDERNGQEKILIRTVKGDYIHIDIDSRELQMYFAKDIKIKTDGNFYLDVAKDIHIKSGGDLLESCRSLHMNASKLIVMTSGSSTHINASGVIRVDGAFTFIQSGIQTKATDASPESPQGERNT